MDDVIGKSGLIKRILKDVIQQLLEDEMDEHLSREKYERDYESDDTNYSKGHFHKVVKSRYGRFKEIETRNSTRRK